MGAPPNIANIDRCEEALFRGCTLVSLTTDDWRKAIMITAEEPGSYLCKGKVHCKVFDQAFLRINKLIFSFSSGSSAW